MSVRIHLLQRDAQRAQQPHVLPEHGQLHGGAVATLQGQQQEAAEQHVPERHSLVLGQQRCVQVVEGRLARRGHPQIQRGQHPGTRERPEQGPGEALHGGLQEEVAGGQEDTGQPGQLGRGGDHPQCHLPPALQQQEPLKAVGDRRQRTGREELRLHAAALRLAHSLVQADERQVRPIGGQGGAKGEVGEEEGAEPGCAAQVEVAGGQDQGLGVG